MSRLLALDGTGGGQAVRTALALSALTGQGFEMTQIRAGKLRPGLRPEHLAVVRSTALVCGAKVGGVFEGSLDLRFEPSGIEPGDFRFEVEPAAPATAVLQTVMAPLSVAARESTVAVLGSTHPAGAPSLEYLASHWAALARRCGLRVEVSLRSAGFAPRGGGEIVGWVAPLVRPTSLVDLDRRGALREVRGVSGGSRLKGVAERQRDAAGRAVWERRRLEMTWETVEVPAASRGSFLYIEAAFENGRGAWSLLGGGGVSPERLGERAAAELLSFLDSEGAVDAAAADQLIVPLVAGGSGGRLRVARVSRHLETVVRMAQAFGVEARIDGALASPGVVEVAPR